MENEIELTQADIEKTLIALNDIRYICIKSKCCKKCPLGYMKNLDEHNCMLYQLIDMGLLPCDWSVKKVTRLLDTAVE
ncbi:hypothetical protein KGF41_14180 [Clostridioides sp. ZZV14-6150]|uniref:hypothetical protein n=1 Tax=Clostridioides sp. ZZV14-6150 TaxID=2811493 RepID=UPI001D10CDB5|nr:hypothetical protein [Clostridioides sp. ZZV14-6150]